MKNNTHYHYLEELYILKETMREKYCSCIILATGFKTDGLFYERTIQQCQIFKANNKTFINSTYREVHVVELIDERLHPGLILFVGLFVHLKHDSQKNAINLRNLIHLWGPPFSEGKLIKYVKRERNSKKSSIITFSSGVWLEVNQKGRVWKALVISCFCAEEKHLCTANKPCRSLYSCSSRCSGHWSGCPVGCYSTCQFPPPLPGPSYCPWTPPHYTMSPLA